jgi:precorrin-6y C5,15-methyltransferase (decarboxylating) CbiE subunit
MEMTERRITIVGCGPGSPDYVTPAARTAALAADVLVGAERLLSAFPAGSARRIVVRADIPEVLDRIGEHLAAGRRIAILVSGDPGLFSLAQPVMERFGAGNCRVIPGISSVQAAFARLGIPWHNARILSAHKATPQVDVAALRQASAIAVLLGRADSLAWCMKLWDELGESYQGFLCEDLTLADESVRELERNAPESAGRAPRGVVVFARKD